jgi:hypothetical protein
MANGLKKFSLIKFVNCDESEKRRLVTARCVTQVACTREGDVSAGNGQQCTRPGAWLYCTRGRQVLTSCRERLPIAGVATK